ncbi:MAG: amino acid ABC transporter permease [Lactobacillaceae bacterium]|jgi:putative glutamine transport system permease protein|nr:amino acid ABC transporter permease [Lactobacillaceae bacterium]
MIEILTKYFATFADGFLITLESSIIALIGSLVLGTLFAVLQLVPNKFVNRLAQAYVEIFRNIPLLVITLFFFAFVAPLVTHLGIAMDGFTAGTIGLTLYTSSFIAEVIRASINAIPKGQMEAGRTNGMTWWQTMRLIILPQAFKMSIPSLGNQFINLVKNSSVLAFVAGMDLMYQANNIAQSTFDSMGTYMVVALFYLVITLPLSYGMKYIEYRSNRGGNA